MEKKRVYQVAKDFHVSSEALLSLLRDSGYEVKSHMSVVNEDMFETITKQFEKQREAAVKDIQKRKKISEAISHEDKETPEKKPQKKKRKKEKDKESDTTKGADKKDKTIRKTKPAESKPKKKDTAKKEGDDTGRDKKSKSSTKKKREDKRSRSKSRKQRMKEHQDAVQNSFKKTMASISSDSRSRSKKSRSRHASKDQQEDARQVVRVSEFISVGDLAKQMDIPITAFMQKCLEMGLMVSVNQSLDMDTITLLADEFGYEVENVGEYGEDLLRSCDEEAYDEENEDERPPVVTVMGHVDHGKTTLLDYIRKTNVVAGESGGITQHIGAYSVTLPDGKKITFIDTPGHEAFTAMRARGAKVTDIVILIVAADDGLMPQTIEAINHAKEAGVPIVIAINKIDLPNADAERVKGDLARRNVLVEDWGGTYQCQEISAKQGLNIDKLLEKVLLESEMLELKADSDKLASGVIIDSHLDKGLGAVATVLIESGNLATGDAFITGMITGRVRAMLNEKGDRVEQAGPSRPVQIFGMNGVPKAGDTFYGVDNESEARDIAHHRRIMKREQISRRIKRVTLDDVYNKIKDGLIKELKMIIKADVDGSAEALADALTRITHEEVRVRVIHQAVGGINENDVLLAAASGAVIIGFHVRPTPDARELAAQEKVDIKLYQVIYEAIEDVEKALSGLLSPKITEKIVGTVEIREVFKLPRIGNVAGCYVTSGTVRRNSKIRLIRDNIEIYSGSISSLKRFKEDVTEVNQGYECGLSIDNYDDIKVGDVIEVVEIKEEARTV